MEFKAIETQEELDRIIQDRLARQKEKYADYDELKSKNTDLETQIGSLQTTMQTTIEETTTTSANYDKQLVDLNAKIAGYETANLRTRIALQNGLPFDLADRLVGNDEESIKADAERLAAFVSKPKQTPVPLKTTEQPIGEGKSSAYKNLLKGLKPEGE